jgi:uncharacterized protein
MNHERLVIELISSDITRMHALHAVASLRLPDWLIAAGFVRNAIWDYLFDKKTPLNDADVIYYCASIRVAISAGGRL